MLPTMATTSTYMGLPILPLGQRVDTKVSSYLRVTLGAASFESFIRTALIIFSWYLVVHFSGIEWGGFRGLQLGNRVSLRGLAGMLATLSVLRLSL